MIPVHCPLCCDQPFEDQQALFFHLRGLRNNLFCPICSDRFATLELLVTHLSRTCSGTKSLTQEKKEGLKSSSNDLLSVSGAEPPDDNDDDHFDNRTDTDTVEEEEQTSDSPSTSSLVPPHLNKLSKKLTIKGGTLKNRNVQKKGDVPSTSTDVQNSRQGVSPTSSQVSTCVNNRSVKNGNVPFKISAEPSPILLKPGPLSYKLSASSQRNSNSNTSVVAENSTSKSECVASTDSEVVNENPFISGRKNKAGRSYRDNVMEATFESKNDSKTASNIIGIHSKSSFTKQDSARKKRSRPNEELCFNGVDELSTKGDPLHIPPLAKRSRGRPRKLLNGEVNPIKTPPTDNVQFVLPDIIDETELQVTSSSNDVHCNQSTSLSLGHTSKTNVKTNGINPLPSSGLEINQTSNGNKETDVSNVDESVKIEAEEEYNCSACNMQFMSVYDHIKRFHNGEEVVVELPEAEITEDLKAFQAGSENKVAIETKENEPEPDNDIAPKPEIFDIKPIVDPSSHVASSPEQNASDDDDNSVHDLNTDIPSPNFNPFRVCRSISTTKKPPIGKWVRTCSNKKDYFQFVLNQTKLKKLVAELKNNSSDHPKFNIPMKNLFENPKVNVIEITNKPNSPCFTFKLVDHKKPIPMYIVERDVDDPSDASLLLGGKASYVIADVSGSDKTPIPEESEVIAVMKVILGSDKLLTIENIIFKEKPVNENMVPILQDVSDPKIPLLKKAKMLIWQCVNCLATTWKFPLASEIHFCNACPLCHKPFVSKVTLKRHMATHTKDDSKYCEECHESFSDKGLLDNHKNKHQSLFFCKLCKLFLSKDKEEEHKNLHAKSPSEQFSCSVCMKVFGSSSDVEDHENKSCRKLEPKYNCSLCDKKFYSLTAHTYHTMEHTKISVKFPCRYCPKMFIKEKENSVRKAGKKQPSPFIQKMWHERIHTRQRPYLCSACPKRFRSFPNQNDHEQKAHQLSTHRHFPVYECNICDKLFRTEDLLTKHSEEHRNLTTVFN